MVMQMTLHSVVFEVGGDRQIDSLFGLIGNVLSVFWSHRSWEPQRRLCGDR